MQSWQGGLPTWHVLRKLGQSPIVAMTIFVPLLGYLLFFNEHLAEYLKINFSYLYNDAQPKVSEASLENYAMRNRIRLLYLGLVLAGIASVLFKVMCPREIIYSANEYDFVRNELEVMTPEQYRDLRQKLTTLAAGRSNKGIWMRARAASVAEASELLTQPAAIAIRGGEGNLAWNDWIQRNRQVLTNGLLSLYAVKDQSSWVERALVAVSYLAGFVLVIIPSSVVFWRIVKAVLKVCGTPACL